jgi:uncharacterized protein with NRDE domain
VAPPPTVAGAVCLLIAVFGLDPDAPLVVAANRDERLDRPARAMTVLHAVGPRTLGGLDEQAGGTWLAVNEHGVVAGLTNRPAPDGADPTRRSRGELPLALSAHATAASAVEDFVGRVSPGDYNPAWLLVGDRDDLFFVDLTEGSSPSAQRLGPGVHVLENNPLGTGSAKATNVRALLGPVDTGAVVGDDAFRARLGAVLADHSVPSSNDPPRIIEALPACVHSEAYGTRSSTIVRVQARRDAPPGVWFADGHPCTTPFVDATALWSKR